MSRCSSLYIAPIKHLLHVQSSRYSVDAANIPIGLGSGFIWDKQGHIVTNYHGADV